MHSKGRFGLLATTPFALVLRRPEISTNALIRDAIDEHLYDLTATRLGRSSVPRLKAENLQQPLVSWTQAEQEFADELMRVFREEDR